MGGCASKPKGFDEMLPKPLPTDAQISPKEVNIDAKSPAEEVKKAEPEPTNVVVDEKTNEAPLVDLSEPEKEEVVAEQKALVSVVEKEIEPDVAETAPTTSPIEAKVEESIAKPEIVVEAVAKVENKSEDAPLVTL